MKNKLMMLVALCGVMGTTMAAADGVDAGRYSVFGPNGSMISVPVFTSAGGMGRAAVAEEMVDEAPTQTQNQAQQVPNVPPRRNKKFGNIGMGVGGTLALGGIAGGLTSIFGSKKRQELKKYLFRKDLQGLKLSDADQKLIKQMRLEVLTSTLATLIGVTTLGVGYSAKPKTTKQQAVQVAQSANSAV